MGNRSLQAAKIKKNDEFYTKLEDIEAEVNNYKDSFKGKVVYCNCDDPYESNFFKYFVLNFNRLGLKKLIATGYYKSPKIYTQLDLFGFGTVDESAAGTVRPYSVSITEVKDYNEDGRTDLADVEWLLKNKKNSRNLLSGDGDFRSEESIELLKEADIVVTNPPFSLFREYVAQLYEYGKKFLIIGNFNAVTYKEIFPLIKDNKMWLGNNFVKEFIIPEDTPEKKGQRVDSNGVRYQQFGNITWFTNLDHKKRHDTLYLGKSYKKNPQFYPKYDNYDAIEVSKVAEIPYDYDGVMGVPITYLVKHNPDQFEILGSQRWAKSQELLDVYRGNVYPPDKDKATLIEGKETYDRIFIKHKKEVNIDGNESNT